MSNGFQRSDFAHLADVIRASTSPLDRENRTVDDDTTAILSNHFNVILAALDQCGEARPPTSELITIRRVGDISTTTKELRYETADDHGVLREAIATIGAQIVELKDALSADAQAANMAEVVDQLREALRISTRELEATKEEMRRKRNAWYGSGFDRGLTTAEGYVRAMLADESTTKMRDMVAEAIKSISRFSQGAMAPDMMITAIAEARYEAAKERTFAEGRGADWGTSIRFNGEQARKDAELDLRAAGVIE